MAKAQIVIGEMTGGVNITVADIIATGYANSNTMINTAVTQKPKYVLISLNGSTNAYSVMMIVIDVQKNKYSVYQRWNGSFEHTEDANLSSVSASITVSDSNVGVNAYALMGGLNPYYSICIYY